MKTFSYTLQNEFPMLLGSAGRLAHLARCSPDTVITLEMGTRRTDLSSPLKVMAMGIRKGDKVTICMANTPQALDCFYALNRIGAIPNMIHPLSAAKEIAFYLNFSKSKAILTLDQFYYKVAEIVPELENPTKILIARIADELPMPLSVLYPMTKGGKADRTPAGKDFTLWYDMVKAGKDTVLPADDGKFDECGAVLYSGGTTGTTKGIMLYNLNFNALAMQTVAASGFTAEQIADMKMLSVMPVFHGFGLGIGIHTALIGGAVALAIIPVLRKALRKEKPTENAPVPFGTGVRDGFCSFQDRSITGYTT